eukprot:m.55874 g.55874  ORF g.55874 m.55874 type:complete len:579 (-) comp7638_c0_seq2:2227-3963(-)
MGIMSMSERRLALVIGAVLCVGFVHVLFDNPPNTPSDHQRGQRREASLVSTAPLEVACPTGYADRLQQAEMAVNRLKSQLDELTSAKADVTRLEAEKAEVMRSLEAEKAQLKRTEALLAEAKAATTAPRAAETSPDKGDQAYYQRIVPMAEGEPIPYVGELLAYEGWKAGSVERSVLLGEDASIADGDVSSCKYMDVLFQHRHRERCTLIVDQSATWNNFEDSRKGEGWFGEGFAMPSALAYSMNTTSGTPLRESIPREKFLEWIFNNRDQYMLPFMQNKKAVIDAARALIGVGTEAKDGSNAKPLLVMCANHGHFPLLLNFFCSLRAAKIPFPQHFIVTTSAKTAADLTNMGLTAFYHEGLGTFPTKASEGYGDEIFVRMMMLKQFAVYVALCCRYDVLFQDVDLTWLKDPVPTLQREAEFFHGQFMDDGARNFLNAPYMANSGFFYLRSDFLSLKFWDAVTQMMLVGPNQRIVARMLDMYTARYGMKVRSLPHQVYTNGKHLITDRKRDKVEMMLKRAEVLHFCWTLNIEDKWNKMMVHDSVHISRECYFNDTLCGLEDIGKDWPEQICTTQPDTV